MAKKDEGIALTLTVIIRAVCGLALIYAVVVPKGWYELFQKFEIQVMIGVILLLLALYDMISAIILLLAIAVSFGRNIQVSESMASGTLDPLPIRKTTFVPFTTEENLKQAQNHVVKDEAYEDKGVKGLPGAYGAQGLDDMMPGLPGRF